MVDFVRWKFNVALKCLYYHRVGCNTDNESDNVWILMNKSISINKFQDLVY